MIPLSTVTGQPTQWRDTGGIASRLAPAVGDRLAGEYHEFVTEQSRIHKTGAQWWNSGSETNCRAPHGCLRKRSLTRFSASDREKRKTLRDGRVGLAGGPGFEPGLAESESAVLPLDDPPGDRDVGARASAWSTGAACGPCAGRPSCAPPRGRRGSRSRPCAAASSATRRSESAPG